jgi:hypothetical protein
VTVTIPEASVQAPVTTGDVNHDGVVNALDLDLVVERFGQ